MSAPRPLEATASLVDPQMTADQPNIDPLLTQDQPADVTGDQPTLTLTGIGRMGPYVLLAELRRWRNGIVYRAAHPQLRRTVEVQVYDPAAGPDEHAAFLEMARKCAALQSPFIVADVLEASSDNGVAYLARQIVEVEPITDFLPPTADSPLLFPNDRLAQFIADIAQGLAVAHAAGLMHGSITMAKLGRDAAGHGQLRGFGEPIAEVADPVSVDLAALAAAVGEILVPVGTVLPARGWIEAVCQVNAGVARKVVQVLDECRYGAVPTAAAFRQIVLPIARKKLIPILPIDRGVSLAADNFFAFALAFLLMRVLANLVHLPSDLMDNVYAGFLLLWIGYLIAWETFAGFTPFRRVVGLRLVNQRGEQPMQKLCLVRSILFVAVVTGTLVGTWVLIHNFSWIDNESPFYYRPILFVVVSLSGLGFYGGSAYCRRDRLAPHDWLTGVFWAKPDPDATASKTFLTTLPPVAALTMPIRDTPITLEAITLDNGSTPVSAVPAVSVDQYDLGPLLGQGGMGAVYQAYDRTLGRTVAFKLIRAAGASAVAVERFRREAQLAAQIDHPHVARVYGAGGAASGEPYMVMEYLSGATLADLAKEKPVALADAWRWILQAAEGLQAADRIGIIHRDIKPANLMLTADGALKVTDFGLSKTLTDSEPEPTLHADELPTDTSLTRTGAILGTPMYMSPEQAAGLPLDRRSDMYALGLTLVYLLTGKTPFPSSNLQTLLQQQATEVPPAVVDGLPELSPTQMDLLRRLLAKDRNDRPGDCETLVRELQRLMPRPLEYASVDLRMSAYLVDFFLLGLVSFLWTFFWDYSTGSIITKTTVGGWLWLSLPKLLAVWLLLHGLARHGSTLGLRFHRLRVIHGQGQPPGFLRALVRLALIRPELWTMPLWPVFLALSAMVIYDLAIWLVVAVWFVVVVVSGFTCTRFAQRQSVPDLLTNTRIVRLHPDQIEPRTGWRWWLPW